MARHAAASGECMLPIIVYLAPNDLDALKRRAARDGERPAACLAPTVSAYVRSLLRRHLAR